MCLPSGQRRRVPWPLHPSRPLRSNPSSQKSASASLTDHISRKTFFWASCLCNPSILAHGVILRVPGRVTSASSVSFKPKSGRSNKSRYETIDYWSTISRFISCFVVPSMTIWGMYFLLKCWFLLVGCLRKTWAVLQGGNLLCIFFDNFGREDKVIFKIKLENNLQLCNDLNELLQLYFLVSPSELNEK